MARRGSRIVLATVAMMLVVAVLGLVSLTGCSNASGGTSKADGQNLFLGKWVSTNTQTISGVTVIETRTLNFKSDGLVTFTLHTEVTGYGSSVPGYSYTYEYTASGNTATLNYSGVSMTITLRADGKIIWSGTSYTKQ